MTNLLEQAINADDGDDAAKLIRNALGIEAESQRSGLTIATSAPASSASGFRPRRGFWPR